MVLLHKCWFNSQMYELNQNYLLQSEIKCDCVWRKASFHVGRRSLSLRSISTLRYSSLTVVRLEFLYVETAISLWWDSSLTSLKLFGTGSAERLSNHSIDRMRTIWDSIICLSYCRPIGNVCSKTSNFERPKKAIFESDKEILENGQRDFLKCKALTFWSEPCVFAVHVCTGFVACL